MQSLKVAVAGPLKRAFRALGLEVRDRRRIPSYTFLGLRSRPIRAILDVGANVGQFARTAQTVFPEASLYCFEPLPSAHRELAAWAEGVPRVRTFNLALGVADGELAFHEHTDHPTSSSLLASDAGTLAHSPELQRQRETRVPVRRLDSVLAAQPLPPGEILLKLDVQGYEAHVLRGAPETLQRVTAVIAEVCLDHFYEGQATFPEIDELCRAAGLAYAGNLDQVYGADGHVSFFDALYIRP